MTSNPCAACCQDLVLPIRHLLAPQCYLDADGLAFLRAHGFEALWQSDEQVEFELHALTFRMTLRQLLFPDVYLAEGADRKVFYQHDLDQAIRENDTIRVRHRCDQLDDAGLCRIYATRPRACREFACATREDCSQPAAVARVIPLSRVQ